MAQSILISAQTGITTTSEYDDGLAPPTIEEISAPIRARRDDLLAASDWAMTPDAPTDKAAWIAYRAALRDIPQQPGFPYDVAWPEKPE
jgi:hypothetical protein